MGGPGVGHSGEPLLDLLIGGSVDGRLVGQEEAVNLGQRCSAFGNLLGDLCQQVGPLAFALVSETTAAAS